MSDYEKEIDSLIHYIKAPEHTHLEAKQALIELMAKARIDELNYMIEDMNIQQDSWEWEHFADRKAKLSSNSKEKTNELL